MSRPPVPIAEAREFGRQVERERGPREKLETVFVRVRRRDPRRWGSIRRMWRLWRVFRSLPCKPGWVETPIPTPPDHVSRKPGIVRQESFALVWSDGR